MSIEVTFYGVRGSRPVVDPNFAEFGGNTACVGLRLGKVPVILDAGTGIQAAGRDLTGGNAPISVFLSHLHHDHTTGFMFFDPLHEPGREINLYVPARLVDAFFKFWEPPFFPIRLSDAAASLHVIPVEDNVTLCHTGKTWKTIPAAPDPNAAAPCIETLTLTGVVHPQDGITLYRASVGGKSVVYASDIELFDHEAMEHVASFVRGSDILICDTHFKDDEYTRGFRGWGHNNLHMTITLAEKAGVERVYLFHHDPNRADDDMRRLEAEAQRRFTKATAAKEGMRVVI